MNDGSTFKRVYFTSPEGDGTQDAKAALANLDVVLLAIKQEKCMEDIENIIILSDNAGNNIVLIIDFIFLRSSLSFFLDYNRNLLSKCLQFGCF